jgi:hypothetical protein
MKWHTCRLTVRYMCVCKWNDTRTDWRLDICVCKWSDTRADWPLDMCVVRVAHHLHTHISNRLSARVLLYLQRHTYLTVNMFACHFICIHTYLTVNLLSRSAVRYVCIYKGSNTRTYWQIDMCVCIWSDIRTDRRLYMCVFVNEVTREHIVS